MLETIGMQGGPGSYSHKVVTEREPDSAMSHFEKFSQAFEALDEGVVDRLWVPIENTRAGFITGPYRLLTSHDTMGRYWMDEEYLMSVRHALLAMEGATTEGIRKLESQPEALRQCPEFLTRMNGQIEVEEGKDTALSARNVAKSGRLDYAAIAGVHAAEVYGLIILEEDIQDDELNLTRFVSVTRREDARLRHQNSNVTAAVLTLASQKKGALHDALGVINRNDINLRYINSRHVPNSPLEVDVMTEMEVGLQEDRMTNVVRGLAEIGVGVTPLGTYPSDPLETEMAKTRDNGLPINVEEAVHAHQEFIQQLRAA